ncbi:MAG: O-antigen ligase family protein, partial [Actinobacteria bacterium]|nr:O-antigen ligase family protein [Actinomycetota bacterium]
AAAATILCGFVLTQSKGAALGLVLGAAVLLGLSPRRLRLLVPATLATAVAAAAFHRLTEPYRADGVGPVHQAGWTVLAAAVAAVVVGAAYAAVDARLDVPEPLVRRAGRGLAALLVAAVLGGAALFLVREPHPLGFAAARWHSFQHYSAHDTASTHFASLGSNRYDFWRVAVHEFERRPLQGIGAWGFGPAYLQLGRSSETPARAHSLELETLAEEGIVGFALLALGVGVPLAAALRRRADTGALACAAAATCWLAQASVDWTWTFPADGIPFFLLLGAAAGSAGRPLARRERLPATAAAVLLALVVFLPPFVSARLSSDALAHPAQATADLRWARRLDPLSTAPEVAAYELDGDLAAIRRAARMEPRNFAFPLLLGQVALARHDAAAARRELARAYALYPRSDLIRSELRLSERRSR